MSIEEYVGRTVDLLAYDNVITSSGLSELEQVLAQPGEGGKIVTGIAKIMQRFILRLFTIQGSLAYLPNEGCRFMADARSGQLRTVTDVFASFSSSVSDIKDQFEAERLESDPLDEVFSDAELVSVELTGDRLRIVVNITTEAGTSARFIAPLEVTV